MAKKLKIKAKSRCIPKVPCTSEAFVYTRGADLRTKFAEIRARMAKENPVKLKKVA